MNKLNKDILFKSLILIGFSLFYIMSLVKDELTLYVHPRLIPIIILAVIIFLIILGFIISDIFKINTRKFKLKNYIIFIAALIIIIFPQICSSTTLSYDNSTIMQPATSSSDDNNINILTFENNVIKINTDNFVSSLDEILTYPDKYEGMDIEINGFIYRDNAQATDDQFIIGRYMLVCCAADMQIAGITCEGSNLSNYSDYTWIKVQGKLHTKGTDASDTIILIENIEQDMNPDTSYVYPY